MATEQEKADLSKKRGQAAASIADPDQRQKYIAAQGNAEAKGKVSDSDYRNMDRDADDTIATGGANKSTGAQSQKVLGSYKHGTDYVPKTGVYKLHGGALHRALGISEDEPIPMEKKEEAAKSKNPHMAAMGRLAVAMHGWKKK